MRAVADVAREMVAPETVIAGPPGVRVCVPIWNGPEGFAVMIEPPIVTISGLVGRFEAGVRFCVWPLITMAELPREMVVPETVIAGPPGVKVCVPIWYGPEGFVVTIEPLIVTIGGLVGRFEAGVRFCVWPLITMAELAREIVVPDTVMVGLLTTSV
jgi:hypothetical protein